MIVAVTLQVKWQADSSEIGLPLCKQLLGEHKDTVHFIYLFPDSQKIFCMIASFPAGLRPESPKAAPITMLVDLLIHWTISRSINFFNQVLEIIINLTQATSDSDLQNLSF